MMQGKRGEGWPARGPRRWRSTNTTISERISRVKQRTSSTALEVRSTCENSLQDASFRACRSCSHTQNRRPNSISLWPRLSCSVPLHRRPNTLSRTYAIVIDASIYLAMSHPASMATLYRNAADSATTGGEGGLSHPPLSVWGI